MIAVSGQRSAFSFQLTGLIEASYKSSQPIGFLSFFVAGVCDPGSTGLIEASYKSSQPIGFLSFFVAGVCDPGSTGLIEASYKRK